MNLRNLVCVALPLFAFSGCFTTHANRAVPVRLREAVDDLSRFIEQEMEAKKLPALSIAIMDQGEVVWAHGFGMAVPSAKVSAAPDTVYRVASISKLFTDMAAMKLAEEGVLDLDRPVAEVVPELRPNNPFAGEVTLRHLMAHHAGLVREPPVGHYFAADRASLPETVSSLSSTSLVHSPGTRFKYSNAGVAAVGRAIELASGRSWEEYVEREIISPLGLRDTTFVPSAALLERQAMGFMWTYDGRVFEAPNFDLGMGPAANLRSTVVDLARVTASWCKASSGLLRPETMEEMLRPQFVSSRRRSWQIGLGFFVRDFRGHRRIGHGGAIYGFASEVACLPDEGLGVAVVTTMDFANQVVERIADRALDWMLAIGEGRSLEPVAPSHPVGREAASKAEGVYARGKDRLRLLAQGEELVVEPPSSVRMVVRRVGEEFLVDDRMNHGKRLELRDGGVVWDGTLWRRITDDRPAPVVEDWRELIGEYGWDHNVLYVLERDARLVVLIEWFAFYPLRAVEKDRFSMPNSGWYSAEEVAFHRDARDRITSVTVGGVNFPRRGTIDVSDTFRIRPLHSEARLRQMATAAKPPAESGDLRVPDLVDLKAVEPGIRLDIRYATTNNFMGMIFYDQAKALMQRPAAEAVARVHRKLAPYGFGLTVYDAYRPWFVTKMFYDATPSNMKIFVADPSRGSRHNRGCAVDLTLHDLATGEPVEMLSGYDEFTTRAYPEYPGGSSLQRWLRALLRRTMEAEGFSIYEHEWWHFDYRDWRSYPIMNSPFR